VRLGPAIETQIANELLEAGMAEEPRCEIVLVVRIKTITSPESRRLPKGQRWIGFEEVEVSTAQIRRLPP
jgi:hypothetical protein